MATLTNDQYQRAFLRWFQNYPEKEKDLELIPFLSPDISSHLLNGGWLKAARKAQFLSTEQMAQNLKVSRAAYCQLEKREMKGRITLEKLAHAAQAMDCELVYAIRPKNKMRFSQLIWRRLLPKAVAHSWVKTRPENRKADALAAIALKLMRDPTFRQIQAWNERNLNSI